MSEGHFEEGKWIEEPLGEVPSTESTDDLAIKVSAAKSSFGKGLDDLLSVSKDLLTTQEGRHHIGKSMDQAGAEIMSTLEETAKKATDYISGILDQKRKD